MHRSITVSLTHYLIPKPSSLILSLSRRDLHIHVLVLLLRGRWLPLPCLSPDAPVPPQVKMAFSEDRALPGSVLRLELGAAPGSLCAVRAVDRSVLLLKPEAELNTEAVSGGTGKGPFAAQGPSGDGRGRDDIGLDLPYRNSVLWWLLGRG